MTSEDESLAPSLGGDNQREDIPQLGGRAGLAYLTDGLRDEDPAVRARAFDALEKVGGEVLLETFISVIRGEESPTLRRRAIQAVGNIGSPEGVAILQELLGDGSYEFRILAANSLGQIGEKHPEAIIPVIETMKERLGRGQNPQEKTTIIALLGMIGTRHPEVMPLLKAMLETNQERVPLVSIAAAEALSGMSREDVRGYLLGRLVLEGPTDFHNFSSGLRTLRPFSLSSFLFEIYDEEELPLKIRKRAIAAIGAIGNPDSSEHLIDLLEGGEKKMRTTIRTALKRVRSRQSLPRLINIAEEHPDWQVKQAAINILGIRQVKSGIPVICKALGHSRGEVRWEAVRALGRIRAEVTIEDILTMLNDSSARVRREARYVMPRLRWTIPDHMVDRIGDYIEALESVLEGEKSVYFRRALEQVLGGLRVIQTA